MQIVDKETSKPFTGADYKMSVICEVGGYMCWSRIRLSAHGRVIKDYPYASFMTHVPMVVRIDANYLNSILASMVAFAVDTAPVIDLSYIANAGLSYRRTLIQRSKLLECIAQPFVPPFLTDNYIPTQCSWMIEVMLNSSNFCIIYEPDMMAPTMGKMEPPLQLKEAKLVLLKVDLSVNLIDLTPSARSLVQSQLSSSPGRLQIPYVDYDMLNLSIPVQLAEFTGVTNVAHYRRCLYAVSVSESDMLGACSTTPIYYRNLGLKKLS